MKKTELGDAVNRDIEEIFDGVGIEEILPTRPLFPKKLLDDSRLVGQPRFKKVREIFARKSVIHSGLAVAGILFAAVVFDDADRGKPRDFIGPKILHPDKTIHDIGDGISKAPGRVLDWYLGP